MSCKPTYKGKRYNSLEELYRANVINPQQKQQAQQLYSQYLDTIFPDSKVKDIVYHASFLRNEDFSLFAKRSFNGEINSGIHFGTKNQALDRAETIERREIFEPLYDGDMPYIFAQQKYNKDIKELTLNEQADVMSDVFEEIEFLEKLQKRGYKIFPAILNAVNMKRIKDEGINNNLFQDNDSVVYVNERETDYQNLGDTFSKLLDSYAVKDDSQIHILGSKKDIEGFKKFVQGKSFNKELAQKIQDKLEKLYPEIKLNITNNPI